MSTIELKNSVIDNIKNTDNTDLLEYINELFETNNEDLFIISEKDKLQLNISAQEHANGNVKLHNDVFTK